MPKAGKDAGDGFATGFGKSTKDIGPQLETAISGSGGGKVRSSFGKWGKAAGAALSSDLGQRTADHAGHQGR